MSEQFIVLATRSAVSYAKKVVELLLKTNSTTNLPIIKESIFQLAVIKFSDGEMEVELLNSVRSKTVFLFTSCARNEANLSVEENKLELYNTLDVLKRSQAKKIIVIEPYMSCSRSDRSTRRNSVGLWVHAKILVSLGANQIISYQMHSDKSRTIMDPCLCAFDDIQATSLLQKYLCDLIIETKKTSPIDIQNDWLFCAVDAGAEKLARKFATAFNTQLVVCNKQRNCLKANCVESINILSAVTLSDKTLWIVDDMIDTGGSIATLLKELSTKKCKEINIMIVHPVLSGKAVQTLNQLHLEKKFNRLVVCDTVYSETIQKELPFIEIISSAQLTANIITTIIQDGQLSDLIDGFSPSRYLEKTNVHL